MGGEQLDCAEPRSGPRQYRSKGESWTAVGGKKFRNPIREQYASQGNPYYATAGSGMTG